MRKDHEHIDLVACPRDAIQGIRPFISTDKKATYVNKLVASNLFSCVDFGSFVSHKSVPQMSDTAEVLRQIKKENDTQLLAIIANRHGANDAISFPHLDVMGYPFSISEEFQRRNANTTREEAFEDLKYISELAQGGKKELLIYISMAFGNPYREPWSEELVLQWIAKLKTLGVHRFSLADTTSSATPQLIYRLFSEVYKEFPSLTLSSHFHSHPRGAMKKVNAAYEAGCRTFEGAMLGYGGCPFAQDELVGNISLESLLRKYKKTEEETIAELQSAFRTMIQFDEGKEEP